LIVSTHDFYIVKAVLTEELNFLPVAVVPITMTFPWRLCLASHAVLLECNPVTGKGLYEHILKLVILQNKNEKSVIQQCCLLVWHGYGHTFFLCLVREVRKCWPMLNLL